MVALLCICLCTGPAFGADREWTFEDATVGALPSGWVAAKTGEGPGSVWKIVVAEVGGKKTQALAQTSFEGPDALFNLCVAKDVKQLDVDLSVQIKAVSGQNDRGGGLVWRYQDAKNYYITRWNPLEDNFRVYHVVDGKRTVLAHAAVMLPQDQWHTVRAVQQGEHIQCYLDGKLLLDVNDATIKAAGAIGLWSKSDAVSWFDNVILKTPAKE
jgi:hypothetical protein